MIGDPIWLPLLGKRFEWGGRGPDAFDCWGLCMEVYRRIGMVLPDYASDHRCEEIHGKIESARLGIRSDAPGQFMECSRPLPWALVTFKIRPPYTSHIGVVLPDCRRFIHIMEACRVAVERLEDRTWSRRRSGFYLPIGSIGLEISYA